MSTVALRPDGSSLPRRVTWTIGALIVAASFVSSVVAPLLTYTTTLAAFGLAHVLSELRFVRQRFGPRIARSISRSFAILLGGVVLCRLLALGGVASKSTLGSIELGLVIALTLSILPALWQHSSARIAGLLLPALLVIGAIFSPVHTLLLLAVLHNLTPAGFIAEVTAGRERRAWMMGMGMIFVVAPALIAVGLPWQLTHAVGLDLPNATLLPVGVLSEHLGAYLPRSIQHRPWAQHAFSAIVFTQCMHYLMVIHVLPRLLGESERDGIDERAWRGGLVALSAMLLVFFWFDFKTARSVYGIAAAVHAWIELPLLMLALLPWVGSRNEP